MVKKNILKNLLLQDESCAIDENITVDWTDEDVNIANTKFNCNCCDSCSCDTNTPCANCNCECICEFDNDEPEYTSPKFDINIIEDSKENKVRITLEFNLKVNDMKTELVCIDLDINSSTYLTIADQLFNLQKNNS